MKLAQKSVKNLVGLLGDLKAPKFHSEINWPLMLYKMCSLYSCVHCACMCVWMAHLDQNDDLNRANNERFCRDQKNLAYSTAEVWWWSSLRNSKVSERKEKIKSCHQGLKNWKLSVSSASARTGSDWIEKPGIPISYVL